MAIGPICPHVLNAGATVLRGSCGNRMTRTGEPGKRLRRRISHPVNHEHKTDWSCLNSHLDAVGVGMPVGVGVGVGVPVGFAINKIMFGADPGEVKLCTPPATTGVPAVVVRLNTSND